MRYLVLTDIHANLEALETCLADARRAELRQVLVLGDLVGYGADPNAVIDVRAANSKPAAMVRGNHDKVAIGLDRSRRLQRHRPQRRAMDVRRADAEPTASGSPRCPAGRSLWTIWSKSATARRSTRMPTSSTSSTRLARCRAPSRPLCLFGHTHYAGDVSTCRAACSTRRSAARRWTTRLLQSMTGVKYLLNPGSVGQPRDGDPRAAYAIVDTAARRGGTAAGWTIRCEVAQAKIMAAGLPEVLARARSPSGR